MFCNVLWDSRSEATAAPLAHIRLAHCRECGLIYNIAFDRKLIQYSPAYENSLHFSRRFQEWAEETAGRLTRQYQLYDKDIIEIGCGQGDFLAIMQRLGNNRVLGFDPSYDPGKTTTGSAKPATVILTQVYSEAHADYPADFICCRHVLEHIDRPTDFLKGIRRTIGCRKACVVYFEVPNALYSLEQMGLWDIIYEHCSYFTCESLANLFLRAGFEPVDLAQRYNAQFLTIEARPARGDTKHLPDRKWGVSNIHHLTDSFQNIYQKEVSSWCRTLSRLDRQNNRVVIWGAGSKGVTFLNALSISYRQIEYIVDVNPRKHGRFVAGTGQRVVGPDFLKGYLPQTIIIMNPIYRREIEEAVRARGLVTQFLLA